MNSFLSLLQFSDGLFPAGGYAHSSGLETYAQEGRVCAPADVRAFIAAHLEGSIARADGAALLRARLNAEDTACCIRLDASLDAMKPARGLREASAQMGKQTLRVACELAPHPCLAAFRAKVEAGETPGHHAVALGMTGHVMGWKPDELLPAYLYASAAMLVNASLRLAPIGQLNGQKILWQLQPLIERLAEELRSDALESGLWSFAPALEIAAMRHASLEGRMFRS